MSTEKGRDSRQRAQAVESPREWECIQGFGTQAFTHEGSLVMLTVEYGEDVTYESDGILRMECDMEILVLFFVSML